MLTLCIDKIIFNLGDNESSSDDKHESEATHQG
jgi:hypothetical protein